MRSEREQKSLVQSSIPNHVYMCVLCLSLGPVSVQDPVTQSRTQLSQSRTQTLSPELSCLSPELRQVPNWGTTCASEGTVSLAIMIIIRSNYWCNNKTLYIASYINSNTNDLTTFVTGEISYNEPSLQQMSISKKTFHEINVHDL